MICSQKLKRIAGTLCSNRLFVPLVASRFRHSFNVAYYHYVGPSVPYYQAFYSGYTLARFASDLEKLSHVFQFVSLSEEIASNTTQDLKERPTLAVTFDDGFDLIGSGVGDVLRHYGIQATSFVVTSCVGNKKLMWRHKLSMIKSLTDDATCVSQYNTMADRLNLSRIRSSCQLMSASKSWDMTTKEEWVDELWDRCRLPAESTYLERYKPYFAWEGLHHWVEAGHSIGFHSHTHPYCSRIRESDLGNELIEPATHLRTEFMLDELPFSYPFGDRLASDLEERLFQEGQFSAFFGIAGPGTKGSANHQLDRIPVESDGVAWSIFGRSVTAW